MHICQVVNDHSIFIFSKLSYFTLSCSLYIYVNMSTVYVNVGQCGNQIAKEFWKQVEDETEINSKVKHCFSTHGNQADKTGHRRAVFVDGEKKVLQKLISDKKRKFSIKIGQNNLISGCNGCGSNWAIGHNLLPASDNKWPRNKAFNEFNYESENNILESCMAAIRHEVEACSSFSGFVLTHSLGGGTGAGLGSRITEELRDQYSNAFQISTVVVPHSNGETPVQHYNEILTLSALQQYSDAILMFENDVILQTLLSRKPKKKVSFSDMNEYIASSMFSLFAPVSTLTPTKGLSVGVEPWELIRSVASIPSLKLLSASCESLKDLNVTSPWNKLANKLSSQSVNRMQCGQGIKGRCLSLVCVCRGCTKTQKPDITMLADKFKKSYFTVDWNPYTVDIWEDFYPSIRPSATVCANISTLATEHCEHVVRCTKSKLTAAAYTHWYDRHGTTIEDIKHSLHIVENIIANYNEFC